MATIFNFASSPLYINKMVSFNKYYPEVLVLLVSLFAFISYICWIAKQRRRPEGTCLPTSWPVIGMVPALLPNAHRIHEYATDLLKETGGTFQFRGPYFTSMDMLITSDTSNIHYILSKNFSNYPKGTDFNKMFGNFGDAIFNSDSRMWEIQRKLALKLLHHNHLLHKCFIETSWDKVQNGLIPLLDHASRHESVIDLQDFFQRYTFDTTGILILGHDPASLAIDLPYHSCQNSLNDIEEAVFFRHILPEPIWKLQRFLHVGKERKITKASVELDQFISQCISASSSKNLRKEDSITSSTPQKIDLLTCYMKEYDDHNDIVGLGDRNKFLRDSALSLLVAGKNTVSASLSWFFWLVATNPSEETKIREEILIKLQKEGESKKLTTSFSDIKELEKLVYLHGAICEALRLYPPVAIQHKSPVRQDILPSGERVEANTRIILSFYSMARMETIWGKDCLEFKPQRWISQDGHVKYEPSSKFTAFNAGPRTCLGKDMTFYQMKIVAATLIYNYHFEVVEGHRVAPSNSIIIQMRDGLKVRVTER